MHTMRLGVGVVTYNNSPREIERFARAYQLAQKELGIETRLYYVDNGEASGLADQVPATAIPSKGNRGFAASVNELLAAAIARDHCDALVIANPDGAFHREALRWLARFAEKYPRALIEAATFPEEHPKEYDRATFDTNWASGCCQWIPRAAYEALKGFDENFFLYMEDVDFSWRARLAGFQVKYCPFAQYSHPVHGRPEAGAGRRRYLLESGRYFAWKWGSRKHLRRCERELKQVFGVSPASLAPLSSESRITDAGKSRVTLFEEFFIFSPLRW